MITAYCVIACLFFAACISEKPSIGKAALLSAGWPVTVAVVAAIAWKAE
jgi:hypothetical protein